MPAENQWVGEVNAYVSEDVHGTQLSETDGTVELQHPLPDILRRDNRSDTAIDKL